MKKRLFLSLLLLISLSAYSSNPKLNLIFIGNSITQGVLLDNSDEQSPPAMAVKYLERNKFDVYLVNCGVSGCTTVDFLPETKHQFQKVVTAADSLYLQKNATLVFSISLGTNDSAIEGPRGAPISPEQYRVNLHAIVDDLLVRYPNSYIVLHQPIWYSPNTHNGARYLAEGLARLQTYTPQLEAMIFSNPKHILKGDRKAFSYFERHYKKHLLQEKGFSGDFFLHPNEKGAKKLGEFWGKAIEEQLGKVLKE